MEAGEEGEICVDVSEGHPAGLFVGYYRDRRWSAAAFSGRRIPYRRYGVARRGRILWFIGRATTSSNPPDTASAPFEVESALITHPAVVECAITGVARSDRGQGGKATIMLAKGYLPSDALKKNCSTT